MKVLLTLDYELFLGLKTGSVNNCLIEPMDQLLQEVNSYNAKFTIFVDAAYLYKLNKLKDRQESLKKDYYKVCNHLLFLKQQGHDIQLHIHPQWYFSNYNGSEWKLDTQHYKLCDVDEEHMLNFFLESKELLDTLIGENTIAFRAGGFSAQPTLLLSKIFKASGLKIDASVCPGTSYDSDYQKYDYRNVPNKNLYHFSKDICQEDINGDYLEVPISMIQVSPMFHWKLALTKLIVKIGGREYKRIGDGQSVKSTGKSVLNRMTQTVQTMATIDEYKASLLKQAYQNAQKKDLNYFCVLGHPKLATPYSIKKVGEFCEYVKNKSGEFVTISGLL